jgi:hypothetical protein
MQSIKLANKLISFLKRSITGLPEGFYDSFKYTSTGRNLTHPITLGLLTKFVWEHIDGVVHVGIDHHLNAGRGIKFQPDLVAYADISAPTYLLFLDYESPNSSDGRVIYKDVEPFLAWSQETQCAAPYIIMTSLPDKPVNYWRLWERADEYEKCKQSPYRFWYDHYSFGSRKMGNIAVINLDGKRVKRTYPP